MSLYSELDFFHDNPISLQNFVKQYCNKCGIMNRVPETAAEWRCRICGQINHETIPLICDLVMTDSELILLPK